VDADLLRQEHKKIISSGNDQGKISLKGQKAENLWKIDSAQFLNALPPHPFSSSDQWI